MNQASEQKKTSNRIKEMLKMGREGGGGGEMQAKKCGNGNQKLK